jgi:hypothetical protein
MEEKLEGDRARIPFWYTLHTHVVRKKEQEKKNKEAMVESVIRSKAGNDEKLFTKMKSMWEVFGIEANATVPV